MLPNRDTLPSPDDRQLRPPTDEMPTSPNDREARLSDLLLLWEDRWRQGHDTPAIELCQCHAELVPELQRRIAALKAFSATICAALSGAALNLSMQITEVSSLRATSPATFAWACEVPPVTQPPQLKPTIIVATAVAAQAHRRIDLDG
jgi:hypothetical protein